MLNIRDYQPSDERRIWQILESSLLSYGLSPDSSGVDSDLRNVEDSYVASGGVFRILVDGEAVLGMYGLHNECDSVAELRKMYLDPTHKGRDHCKLELPGNWRSWINW